MSQQTGLARIELGSRALAGSVPFACSWAAKACWASSPKSNCACGACPRPSRRRSASSRTSNAAGSGFAWAEKPEDRSRLWKARHDATYANLALRPGSRLIGTDACVPIASLVECVKETLADVAESGMVAPLVGHVGDGNFHLGIVFDPGDADERARAEALAERVALRAIRLGGTCTGEHGIGLHRKHQLVAEHAEGVALMRSIKQALDPKGIMNPGKMFDHEDQRA